MNGTDLFNKKEWEVVLGLFRTHGTAISELAKNHRIDRWTSGQKICFFNDGYLISYTTDQITTKPILKIDLESSIHLFNFKNILTQMTIKTNGKEGNWNFGGHLD